MKSNHNAVQEAPQQTGVAVTNTSAIGSTLPAIDLDKMDEIPDLDDAEEIPLDLTVEYWSPEKEGESKKVFFAGIQNTEYSDQETGESRSLRTAFFYEKQGKEMVKISNASSRLVATLENNGIQPGTPLKIVYTGKKKNATNSYQSDRWRVTPLRLAI